MRSDHRRLHVALAVPRAGSATPRKTRCPRRLHRPAIAIGELNTGVHRGASPAPRRGAAVFNHALRQSSSSRRPRAGSATLHRARWPLASFTALLFPSSLSSRLFAVEHCQHPGGCSFFQLCAPTTVVSTSPSRPLWPGPPRSASESARPASARRLHHPAIAIVQLTTGVRRGSSPATRRGAAAFNHALRQSSSPRRVHVALGPGPPRCTGPAGP